MRGWLIWNGSCAVRERYVTDHAATLQDAANEMGCTRERVRQLEESGLAKLRKALTDRGFNVEDVRDILSNADGRTSHWQDMVG